jgi:hypothetical protein
MMKKKLATIFFFHLLKKISYLILIEFENNIKRRGEVLWKAKLNKSYLF